MNHSINFISRCLIHHMYIYIYISLSNLGNVSMALYIQKKIAIRISRHPQRAPKGTSTRWRSANPTTARESSRTPTSFASEKKIAVAFWTGKIWWIFWEKSMGKWWVNISKNNYMILGSRTWEVYPKNMPWEHDHEPMYYLSVFGLSYLLIWVSLGDMFSLQ